MGQSLQDPTDPLERAALGHGGNRLVPEAPAENGGLLERLSGYTSRPCFGRMLAERILGREPDLALFAPARPVLGAAAGGG